jgi:NAD+ diphosphatase
MPLPSFADFIPSNDEDRAGSFPETGFWLVFRGAELLVARTADGIGLPRGNEPPAAGTGRVHVLGRLDGAACRTVAAPNDAQAPEGFGFEPVRSLFGLLSDSLFGAIARGLEIVEWERTSRFCGTCGAAMRPKPGERAMECGSCGSLVYPRISPAVIVAVVRDDRILLARAHRFRPGFFSVLAGFVEPGETLEQCVAREVREETGIEVRDVRYFASQPWPFPHSLMVAFTAAYAGGEIRIEPAEIADAGWFSAAELPAVPDRITVARRLIDWFAAGGRP